MKKRNITQYRFIFIVLLFIATLGVIVYGNSYFEKKNKNQVVNSSQIKSSTQNNLVTQTDSKPVQTSNPNQSMMEYLMSESKQYGSARISFLGSSISNPLPKEKTWISLLQTDLKTNSKGLEQLGYMLNDVEDKTTMEILEEKKVDSIVQQVPTVIFFESAVLNDYRKNIAVDSTLANLEQIMNQFKEKAPNAKVIILSPNRGADTGTNSTGLKAKDYIDRSNEFFKSKGWAYIDLYDGFEKQRVKEGRALTQVLLKDGHKPNEIGNQYIYTTIKEYVTKQGE